MCENITFFILKRKFLNNNVFYNIYIYNKIIHDMKINLIYLIKYKIYDK